MKLPANELARVVLRLYPSVPINMRQSCKDTVLPVGGGPDGKAPIFVRKGEAVSYCVYAMQRRKDIYGEDANEFRPDRWDPNERNGRDLRHINWAYLPFNGGPRVCLGRKSLFHPSDRVPYVVASWLT